MRILAGRRDVAFLQQFNSKIGQYSDDGKVFNAAYGYRLRTHFGRDQLVEVIQLLRRDPTTRQAVLQIWDPADLTKKTKDKACNVEVVFDTRGGRLNMSVFNRSNDAWYGAYGANAVHFSILQEFVACSVGLRAGVYRQVSNNLHLYTELYDAKKYIDLPPDPEAYDHYSAGVVRPSPLMLNGEFKSFLQDCERFCQDPFEPSAVYVHPFLKHVAQPMAMVSRVRKTGAGDGRGYAAKILSEDWRRATMEWIVRRDKLKS
ncbi:MAG: thymidylate synthase [Fluviibacter sp.]